MLLCNGLRQNKDIIINVSNHVHPTFGQSGHSTETTLLHIKNEIHSRFIGQAYCICLTGSVSTTDHTTILKYLKSCFGVCSTALKWFTSYLRHHFQATKIGSLLSELHELLFGVPQGSAFGPLLFLYTTPLSKVIGRHPDHSNITFMKTKQSCLFISLTKTQPWVLTH